MNSKKKPVHNFVFSISAFLVSVMLSSCGEDNAKSNNPDEAKADSAITVSAETPGEVEAYGDTSKLPEPFESKCCLFLLKTENLLASPKIS